MWISGLLIKCSMRYEHPDRSASNYENNLHATKIAVVTTCTMKESNLRRLRCERSALPLGESCLYVHTSYPYDVMPPTPINYAPITRS